MNNYSENTLLNQEYIKTLWAIDNGETFTELVSISQEVIPIAIGEIQQALKTADLDSLEQILHKLKGSAGAIGAQKMELFVEEMRLSVKKPNYEFGRNLKPLKFIASRSLKALSAVNYRCFYL